MRSACIPRASGGIPFTPSPMACHPPYSPRKRGWSLLVAPIFFANLVFPAPAGVVLKSNVQTENIVGIPRASGGVPILLSFAQFEREYSPRKRGCSLLKQIARAFDVVFPAQAGVFLSCRFLYSPCHSIPRASGGGPWDSFFADLEDSVFPARAGVFRLCYPLTTAKTGIPRASGGVPCRNHGTCQHVTYSPRKRGWSYERVRLLARVSVFPAQAGVFPDRSSYDSVTFCIPCSCGGVPMIILEKGE